MDGSTTNVKILNVNNKMIYSILPPISSEIRLQYLTKKLDS